MRILNIPPFEKICLTRPSIARLSELFSVLAAFTAFVSLRLIAWLHSIPFIEIYADAYTYYVPAGIAYINGSLPDSVNPQHPPLAKYIIGFFAVYLGNAGLSGLLFGCLMAVPIFLIARKLTSNSNWASVTVWMVSFDLVNISISIVPMLDVFMLFFSLLGTYMILVAKNKKHYLLAGLVFGFALASKWEATFLLIPSLLFVVIERKYLAATLTLLAALGGYTLSYAPLIAVEGFSSFLSLQVWMFQFMFGGHGLGTALGSLWRSLLAILIFHTTTFDYLTGYDPLFHPEGFRFLGANYISFADAINPLITLLFFPMLLLQTRRHFTVQDRARFLMVLILLGLVVWEIFINLPANTIELWFSAPIDVVLSILMADWLKRTYNPRTRSAPFFYAYLALVALWPLFANAIVALRIAHYWTLAHTQLSRPSVFCESLRPYSAPLSRNRRFV